MLKWHDIKALYFTKSSRISNILMSNTRLFSGYRHYFSLLLPF